MRSPEDRVFEVLDDLGMTPHGELDLAFIAKAMESMLMMIDMQADMIEELSATIVEERKTEEQYFLQVNDYSIAMEDENLALQAEIVRLRAVKPCSCGKMMTFIYDEKQ